MKFPDLYANKIRLYRLRTLLVLGCTGVLVFALLMLKSSHDNMAQAQATVTAMRSAEALLPGAQPRQIVIPIDAKQKAYLADLKATAAKLSVDWGARIASVESAMNADLSLNALRVDGQRGEIELKGETSSNAKLTAIVNAMQKAGLDARVGRLARLTNGLDYSILVVWPQ
jgi:hypothetical protein